MLIPTSVGAARLHVHDARPDETVPRGRVVLLHGAGTDSTVPQLVGLAETAADAGWLALRLDMPHRVAGRRAPPPAGTLDAALADVVATLPHELLHGDVGPLVLVGRSTGARVACRTARTLRAELVVALGYPLVPPPARVGNGGLGLVDPRTEVRRAELVGAGVPVLVVQGERDAFGSGADLRGVVPNVHEVAGADHSMEVRVKDGRLPHEVADEVSLVVLRALQGVG